jgi:hypothetical protein
MPRMRAETQLARVFASIADNGQQLESTAAGILSIVKDHKINSVTRWDEAVQAAYESNGWNTRAGRPNGDDEPKQPVPDTVTQYVSLVRKALKAKMRVMKFETFTALRVAMAKRNGRKDHRGGTSQGRTLRLPAPLEMNFVDVEITKPAMNGALFHDLAVVWSKLPEEPQALLGRQLSQLLHKYLPLVQDSEAPKRKAA